MNTEYYEDNWQEDEFFNIIEDVMIAQLEDIKNITFQGAKRIPKTRLFDTRSGITNIKRNYVYVPNKDREVLTHESKSSSKLLLVDNETIPLIGTMYNFPQRKIVSFERQNGMPKLLTKVGSGDVYDVTCLDVMDGSIDSSKGYFSISKSGVISKCNVITEMYGGGFGNRNTVVNQNDIEPDVLDSYFLTGFYGIQFYIDKAHCWTIRADESNCKVELGCNREQIKSLLYAREEPLTKTGRLSPILHLVSSHNRRIKNGIDIKSTEIKSYLRGQQIIDIGGTKFTVCPPKKLGIQLTENSLRYFD